MKEESMDKLTRLADAVHSGGQNVAILLIAPPPVSGSGSLMIVDDRTAEDVVRLSASWATTMPACVACRGTSTRTPVAQSRGSHCG